MESKGTWESRKRNREDENSEEESNENVKRSSTLSNDADGGLKSSTSVPTASEFIVSSDEFLSLPPELKDVDFTKPVHWRKCAPYTDEKLLLKPVDEKPVFTPEFPALCFHVHAISGRARATTLHLPSERSVQTPIFMPVG
jgi:hypothetical protein